jgi:hypothetical protein
VPTQNIDLLPTLCELCGIAPPERTAEDSLYAGKSLAGLLRGTQEAFPERTLVVQYGQIPEKYDACIIRGPWRLLKGTDLYNVNYDLAQQTNVAGDHPDLVESMREYYDGWWKGLEPMLNEFVPITLGADAQPVVELTCGDWEGIYADNRAHVREAVGGPTGGHWNVVIETPGTYEFTLRRWPEQTRAALGTDYKSPYESTWKRPNLRPKAFPTIARASLKIGEQTTTTPADANATGAIVTATLPAGPTTLQGWFSDESGNDLCGAFFVTVKRVR